MTSWLTSLFLAGVLVMMAFDYPNGTLTVAALLIVALLLVGGWYLLRRPKAVMMTPTMPSVNLTRKFLELSAVSLLRYTDGKVSGASRPLLHSAHPCLAISFKASSLGTFL